MYNFFCLARLSITLFACLFALYAFFNTNFVVLLIACSPLLLLFYSLLEVCRSSDVGASQASQHGDNGQLDNHPTQILKLF